MTTAIIGVGNIGKTVAKLLADGGEDVILAARTASEASKVADGLGSSVTAASVADAIAGSQAVIFAVYFDAMKALIEEHHDVLDGKVVIDPANPVAMDAEGQFVRTLPDGVSAGSVIAGMLPAGAHYVKAFGTLSAESLASASKRMPEPVVLFYATDDEQATRAIEGLIAAAGFDAMSVGGVDHALRIEMFGSLHEFGGLNGALLSPAEARTALAAA